MAVRKKYYRIGDRIKIRTGEFSEKEYILAYTGRSEGDTNILHFNRGKVTLISLEEGNRWQEGVNVENIYKIHYTEMYEILGEDDWNHEDWDWSITHNHKGLEVIKL